MVYRINKSWDKEFPSFEGPKAIGYYSSDSSRSIYFDSSQLMYYRPPENYEVSFDLNQGIESVRRKLRPTRYNNIDTFWRWIVNNIDKVRADPANGQTLQPNIVCFRGLLSRLMKTAYDERDGWIICAAKWKGTIYLMAFDTEADKFKGLNRTEKDLQFTSWGYKFEQYILSEILEFLNYVKKTVVKNYDQTIYKFERIPHSHIVVTEVPPTSEYAFLPKWFLDSFEK